MVSLQLPLVEEYTIGLTYKITPKWLVSADFNYHGWERYSKLTLDFAMHLSEIKLIQPFLFLLKTLEIPKHSDWELSMLYQYDLWTFRSIL
jgi:long-subunit fatty acid transport protein